MQLAKPASASETNLIFPTNPSTRLFRNSRKRIMHCTVHYIIFLVLLRGRISLPTRKHMFITAWDNCYQAFPFHSCEIKAGVGRPAWVRGYRSALYMRMYMSRDNV